MTDIKSAFAHGKAFIPYLMAGDPDLETSAQLILAAQDAGADLIEIGIPFSDPIAEGEVIQQASIRALAAGTDLIGVFELVASIRDQLRVPVVFMTYLNPVFVYGYDKFFNRCVELGVGGVIIPDLPYEEQAEVETVAARFGIDIVTMVAPTSGARVGRIAADAQGFLYLVSSLGVTGVRSEITTDIGALVAQVRAVSSTPCAVGFGISTPEQAAKYAGLSDGVIVGSAIVRLVGEFGHAAIGPVSDLVRSMKRAIE